MVEFAQFLCSELDGAHYLGDGRQAMTMSRIDELSVKLNSLQAKYKHLINKHWVPLQQFASGVMANLSVLAGTDPSATTSLFCSQCGKGNAPPQPQGEDGPGCAAPIPIRLVSADLRAFGLHPSNFPSPISIIPSILNLISADLLLTGGRTTASEPASRVERGSWFIWLYRGLEGLRETKEGDLRGLRDDREAQRQRNRRRRREGEEGRHSQRQRGQSLREREKRSLRERRSGRC